MNNGYEGFLLSTSLVLHCQFVYKRGIVLKIGILSCNFELFTSYIHNDFFFHFLKGSIGAIHLTCLEKWLEESNRSSCELCGHEFQVERTLRYRVIESIVIWLCLKQQRQRNYVHNLHSDLLRCIIVTPLTIACSYICIIAADFYSQNNYDHFPPARWTTYSLLAMISLILFSYFVWTYTAIQHHQKIWYYWWQRTSKVKVTLPEIDENRQISLSDKYVSETIF